MINDKGESYVNMNENYCNKPWQIYSNTEDGIFKVVQGILKQNKGGQLKNIPNENPVHKGNLVRGFKECQDKINKEQQPFPKNVWEESTFSTNSPDSTLTGHMLRCFSDTSGDNSLITPTEIKSDIATKSKAKQKRPFLRKKSGLQRYMPKSAQQQEDSKVILTDFTKVQEMEPYLEFETNLKTNPCNKSALPQRRQVHFKEPEIQIKNKGSNFEGHQDKYAERILTHQITDQMKEFIEGSCNTLTSDQKEQYIERNFNLLNSDQTEFNTPTSEQEQNREEQFKISKVTSSVPNLSENLVKEYERILDEVETENKESAEIKPILSQEEIERAEQDFKVLEALTQNSSFNSDCSVVQRFYQNEPIQKPESKQHIPDSNIRKLQTVLPYPSSRSNPLQLPQEVLFKKQRITDLLNDNESRLTQLQKQLSDIHNNETSSESLSQPLFPKNPTYSSSSKTNICFLNDSSDNDYLSSENITDKNSNSTIRDNTENFVYQNTFTPSVEKSAMRDKMEELDKQIKLFEKENSQLAEIRKENETILRKLKKESDEIEKFKEQQKKNLEIEIQNGKRELKRQKDTLNRYQKLQKEGLTRQEKVELTALRQENEKLQAELKRQSIKFTNDNRRMRNQLIEAEKERDSLKFKNISLEEQCDDLLNILKGRGLNIAKLVDQTEHQETSSNKSITLNSNIENNKKDDSKSSASTKIKSKNVKQSSKPRVRFNLVPQFDDHQNEINNKQVEKDLINLHENHKLHQTSDSPAEDSGIETMQLSDSEETISKKTKHKNKVETIHPNGDREILFVESGNKKYISVDGTTKISFHNGDVLEQFPDKKEIYTFANGLVETTLPSGLKISEFPNGQIEREFSDGSKEVEFPNGNLHFIYKDGSEEIININGSVATIEADGTMTVEKINGEREIRTSSFKRREYPDGSIRILYPNGRLESRYANGRIRIKDKNGKIIMDTKKIDTIKRHNAEYISIYD